MSTYPTFSARAPWIGPDLQTLRNVLRGPSLALPPETRPERLTLPLADGSGDRLAARMFRPETPRPDAPLVVLVHGLGGSEASGYMTTTTAHLLAGGWRVLQLNLRGAGPSRALCRQQYHAGRTADFRDALQALPDAAREHGVVAVGYSLGGNMVLKYAAEFGALRGVVSVSAPIDLAAASYRFLDARNKLYHAHLLRGMKAEALGEGADVSDEERRLLPTLRTILEFDEKIVAPRGGFLDAADYYRQNSAKNFLHEVRTPGIVIHALDDPWIPSPAYTGHDWAATPDLTPILPRTGGHVGFHGRHGRAPHHDQCLVRFLETLE